MHVTFRILSALMLTIWDFSREAQVRDLWHVSASPCAEGHSVNMAGPGSHLQGLAVKDCRTFGTLNRG